MKKRGFAKRQTYIISVGQNSDESETILLYMKKRVAVWANNDRIIYRQKLHSAKPY